MASPPVQVPLTPRPAATVVLLREGADASLEVFLQRRRAAMAFAPGVTVFPGGGVDARDHEPLGDLWLGPPPSWWARRLATTEALAAALVCAAVRETFEECGVLLAGTADRVVADIAALNSAHLSAHLSAHPGAHPDARSALADGTLSLAEFLRAARLHLRTDLLRPWAHWVTPASERTRRYDTWFVVAALPAGQRADGENSESDDAGWRTPREALAEFARGETVLLPPTWTQLDALCGRRLADVLAVTRRVGGSSPSAGTEGRGTRNWEVEHFDDARYGAAAAGAVR